MSTQLAIGSPALPHRALPRSTIFGFVAVLLVLLIYADARFAGSVAIEGAPPPQIVGKFTGAYENGVPVYRLPPMQVTAMRQARPYDNPEMLP